MSMSPDKVARAVAKSLIVACGSEEMGGSEDTSRSVKGLPAPCNLLLPDLATALTMLLKSKPSDHHGDFRKTTSGVHALCIRLSGSLSTSMNTMKVSRPVDALVSSWL